MTSILPATVPVLVFLAFVRPPREATSPLGAPLVSPPQAEDVRGRLEADLAAAREVTLTTLRN